MNATIFDIERNSFVDGPGIRTTVFFKGCNLKCKWCHNPESQAPEKEMMLYKDKCIGCGKCREVCPNHLKKCDFCGKCELFCAADARRICGKEYTVDEVFSEIVKDKSFYETSDGGATFSGGECMLQIDFLCELLKKCKENGIHTAVDTAGNVPWKYFEFIIPYTDMFLFDVKCISENLHIAGTGASNRLIIENLTTLSSVFKGSIFIRIPVIGSFNDTKEEMNKIKEFLNNINFDKIELLPYHNMGNNKYTALNRVLPDYIVPDKNKMDKFQKIFGI
ncbi:MAG: glycyl-radical enzyme activating protein [Clostridia bacterium]|nr:glycyl-radical enzyme activating protein [Clostridia bacterium]